MGLFDRARRRPVRALPDGKFAVELDPDVRELIGSFADQLRELFQTDSILLERLFPPPYGDDSERNQGYAALAGAELVERRLAALDVVTEHLYATVLDEDQLMAWMRTLNDMRLVIGTMLDVDDHGPPADLDEQTATTYNIYEFLGVLLEVMVQALSD